MHYQEFGSTGINVSALGFGCMRLPMTVKDGKDVVDDEKATPLLRRAVELGINFFDSHWFYCNFDSQRAVGAALRPVRDRVYISTKTMLRNITKTEEFNDYLNRTLELMGLDYLDFYHFPALSHASWTDKVLGLKLLDEAEKAKSKGLVRHLSFSFHSDPGKMKEVIDTGAFSSMLGQYNLVDRRNEEVFNYAKSKGLGTKVMGPLMGGLLTDGGQTFLNRMESEASSVAEMCLRFCMGMPSVDMVLSGMSTVEQLENNVKYASRAATEEEWQGMTDKSSRLKELNDLYCTNCNYCAVCPENIRIGRVFQLYLQHKIWGLGDAVRKQRESRWGGNGAFGLPAEPGACTECGACMKACPQDINIPSELKRVWPVLLEL